MVTKQPNKIVEMFVDIPVKSDHIPLKLEKISPTFGQALLTADH
jgi:hypothetical protein